MRMQTRLSSGLEVDALNARIPDRVWRNGNSGELPSAALTNRSGARLGQLSSVARISRGRAEAVVLRCEAGGQGDDTAGTDVTSNRSTGTAIALAQPQLRSARSSRVPTSNRTEKKDDLEKHRRPSSDRARFCALDRNVR